MSKVSRSVQAGFVKNERKMKLRWEKKQALKSEALPIKRKVRLPPLTRG